MKYMSPTGVKGGIFEEQAADPAQLVLPVDKEKSVPFGDYHRTGKQIEVEGLFRCYSLNMNGMSARDDNQDVNNIVEAVATKGAAIVALQEPNRNFQRHAMRNSFHTAMRKTSVHHRGAFSSAQLDWPSNYQPGGTAISVRNKWATRHIDQGADVFGRWSWITLSGRGTTRVTFISAYRVCDGASEAPITARTVRAQQEWMYADRGYQSIDLRQQFMTDLAKLVSAFRKSGNDVVVMMDANESTDAPTSAVTKFIKDCELIDIHQAVLPDTELPETYMRGTKKIDFILVSPRLVGAATAVSLLAYHDGYLSDHRALVVDFDPLIMFQDATSEVVPPTQRRLTSTNPVAVHSYIEFMRAHIDTHRIVEKVADLVDRSRFGEWNEADISQWELIDKILAEGRVAAERKCPRKGSGKHPWSPELSHAGRSVLYWRARQRYFTSRVVNDDMLADLEAALKIPVEETCWLTRSAVDARLKSAHAEFKKVKCDAAKLRADHNKECAKFFGSLHGMPTEKAQAAIEARERISFQFRELRRILGVATAGGLDRIDVPNEYAVRAEGEAVPRVPLVVKEDIADVLLPHTRKRFRQTKETPFGRGVRGRRLGKNANSPDAEAILNGTYDYELEDLSLEAREWLQHLKRRPHVEEGHVISCAISTEDWISGWLKMRESTASAPGSHYGHYKTAAVAARLPEKHADYYPALADIYSCMITLPLKHGFSPKRWRSNCVDAVLEKLPGRPIIEKLRIIMLFEADFNFALKLIWGKRLVRHCEKYRMLGTANHGSRSGRQVTDALLEKSLLYEIARLTRTSLITVDNDAKSCYDRIIKCMAMLACVSLGLPLPAAAMHNTTHDELVHRIKTRHGLLRSYSGLDDDGSEGTGQGSGASPAIWLIYCMTLIAAFARFTPGMHVVSPTNAALSCWLIAIFFVDDGTPGVNDANEEIAVPLQTLVAQATGASQAWERLLFASGGGLEFKKCFAYILYWDLSAGKHRLISPEEIPGCSRAVETGSFLGPIALTYGDSPGASAPVRIETESPWVGRRTLGGRLAPAGNWNDELAFRKNQSHLLAIRFAGSNIAAQSVLLGYKTMVNPKLEFPLAVTEFTQKECDSVTCAILNTCLSKMGYNKNMPRVVVYGPVELGGLDMHDMYIEQGIRQISTLIGHYREQESETGKMIRMELQWCQVQAGTADHLLSSPAAPIDYIESCWIMSIRDFLRTYRLRLEFTDAELPTLLCDDDEFIMDAFCNRGDCTATELQTLNACRMSLQVARLSEISDPSGKYLTQDALLGRTDSEFYSAHRWPRQGRPTRSMWTFWKRLLRKVFSVDGDKPKLRSPLGCWDPDTLICSEWRTVLSVGGESPAVFRARRDGDFDKYPCLSKTRRGVVVGRSTVIVDSLPHEIVPCSLSKFDPRGRAKAVCRSLRVAPSAPGGCRNFSEYVGAQPLHISSLLEHCDLSEGTALSFVDALYQCPRISTGTDGGLLSGLGTFGFVWGTDGEILAKGHGHVPGSPLIMSSTRTELCGMLASLSYLRLVVQYFHVVLPRRCGAGLFCDSKAALSRMSADFYSFGTTWRCRAHYDLESAIQVCLSRLRLSVTWQWVRGHAAKRKKPEEFTWAETLNEEADDLATSARLKSRPVCDSVHWPEQQVSVVGPRGRVCGRLAREIRYCCTAHDLQEYWNERYHWTKTQGEYVDLIAIRASMSKLRGGQLRRMQKLKCGWLPVNDRLTRMDPDCDSGCSGCSPLIEETVDHIFQCKQLTRKAAIDHRFDNMQFEWRKFKTSISLIRALRLGARAWIEGDDVPDIEVLKLPDNEVSRMVRQAYSEQTELGWNVLFRGFWSTSWRLAQEAAFRNASYSKDHQDTGDCWAGRAQAWFFSLFEHIWELRNKQEHGSDPFSEKQNRLAKCMKSIQRLFLEGADLPYHESHPFRRPIESLLTTTVHDQELWITRTTAFLQKARARLRKQRENSQHSIAAYFQRIAKPISQ